MRRLEAYGRALGLPLAYWLWFKFVRLISLTLITYFLRSNQGRLQDIANFYTANELTVAAISAASFVVLLKNLYPWVRLPERSLFPQLPFRVSFAMGLLRGGGMGLALMLVFLASGIYQVLGVFVGSGDVASAILAILVRSLSVIALVYSDEYLFRGPWFQGLLTRLPTKNALALTVAVTLALRISQFDIGWSQGLALSLLTFRASLLALARSGFALGAGMITGLFWVIHPILGLPLFGIETSGVLLVKIQTAADPFRVAGGTAGPLSGIALLGWLALECGLLVRRFFYVKRRMNSL